MNNDKTLKNTEIPVTKNGKPGLMLLPHTPHTIRKTVRSCESCHDSEIALGLGDPKRNVIVDAGRFFSVLQNEGAVPPNFQAKQVITKTGDPIQNAYPNSQARFLNAEEIAAIKNKSDAYKAFRYLDLKAQRFPRLLSRAEFPFDRKHRRNEKSTKKLTQDEKKLNKTNKNSFNEGLIESETIKEFSPDFFKTPALLDEGLGLQKDLFTDEPEFNSKEFQ